MTITDATGQDVLTRARGQDLGLVPWRDEAEAHTTSGADLFLLTGLQDEHQGRRKGSVDAIIVHGLDLQIISRKVQGMAVPQTLSKDRRVEEKKSTDGEGAGVTNTEERRSAKRKTERKRSFFRFSFLVRSNTELQKKKGKASVSHSTWGKYGIISETE